jgi:glycosyltransferase involved in cell wall biosynthesis
MKIHWFSPLPPERSGIASDYLLAVLEPLCRLAEVTLWSSGDTTSLPLPSGACLCSWTGKEWRLLHRGDVLLYHMGNDARFHSWIWEVLRVAPGWVVLHDSCLFDFFWGYFHKVEGFEAFVRALTWCHGVQDPRLCRKLWKGATAEDAKAYPLSLLVLERACGVILHTQEAAQNVLRAEECPFRVLPLPYRSRQKHRRPRGVPRKEPLRLVSFGLWGPHRRLLPFLTALASFPRREELRYEILGPMPEDWNLPQRIQELGLSHLVSLHGWVSEAKLEAVLDRADLAVNLRYPSLGEASGSQLRIWDHALPTLAIRSGWFAEIPEEFFLWIDPRREEGDIHRMLSWALENRPRLSEMGERAREYLRQHHDPACYAEGLVAAILENRNLLSLPVWKALGRRAAEAAAGLTQNPEPKESPWEEALARVGQELGRFASVLP